MIAFPAIVFTSSPAHRFPSFKLPYLQLLVPDRLSALWSTTNTSEPGLEGHGLRTQREV